MTKRKEAAADRYEEFVFLLRRPSMSYTFALENDRREHDRYREQLSLHFLVECLGPERFKGREGEASFFADDTLSRGSKARSRHSDALVEAVGSVIVTKARLEVGGFLPPQMCRDLPMAIAAGAVTSLNANAMWIKRNHAYVTSLMFNGPEFDPIAYLG